LWCSQPIGFGEDALSGEDEVRFEGFDVVVEDRLRKVRVAAELQEALFELGFREGASGVMVGQGCQELACSAMAGVRSGQGIEGNVVAEPCALRSIEQALDAAAVQGGGEVEDGASRGGDGDAVGHTVLGSRGHWVAAVPA